MQRELQVVIAKDPLELNEDERADFVRWNAYALVCELVEMTDEVGWKPWATSRHVNRPEAAREAADMLHFFANLMLALEISGQDLTTAYLNKLEKNYQRHANHDYDGISNKCDGCGRSFDDVPLMREINQTTPSGVEVLRFCTFCAHTVQE